MTRSIVLLSIIALMFAPLSMEAKKKEKKVEVPQLLNYPSAELDEYRLHGGNVVIQGHLVLPEEAKGEKIPQEILNQLNGRFTVTMRDYIVRKEKTSVIDFKDDGTFSKNVYVPYPMFVLVYPLTMVYAMPGDTLNITMDTTKSHPTEGVSVSGTGVSGEVSKLWLQIQERYCQFNREEKDDESPEEVIKWKDRAVERLDSMVYKMNEGLPELKGCSPLAADVLKTLILTAHMRAICEKFEFMDKKDIDKEQFWQEYFSFVALREKYLTDNPLFLIAGDEFFFNRMEYSLMEPVSKAAFGAVTLPAEWNAESAKLRDEHKVLTIRENRKEAMTLMHDKLQLSPQNLSAQICTLRSLFETLDWNKENHDNAAEDVASTLSIITNADLMRRALLTYREYVKEKEIKVVDNKPMTKGDSIFQRIIEPYKGNVLYVDFWEMSCGPCRAGMLHMRDEVEANKDKPIKYLYITDDTHEHCKSFLEPNNIKGEHIHITHSEWGYLQEKFQFSAIPYTFLVDKQGRRRDDATTEQLLAE